MNHLLLIVMDSARYDSVTAAVTPNLKRLGALERRYAYASWTAPSHLAMLMGLMPHKNEPHRWAADVYREEFALWRHRLNAPQLEFKSFVPNLSLPRVLTRLGYRTTAWVSMPVLNPYTVLSSHFDRYVLWPTHNDFAGMIEQLDFPGSGISAPPQFYFLNLGETHYPYMLDSAELPRLHGVHGVFKNLDEMVAEVESESKAVTSRSPTMFDAAMLDKLRRQQIEAVSYIDRQLARLFAKVPPNTHLIVTSDHGELFGEGGQFGHGPVIHEKVFEVPFVEGLVPSRHPTDDMPAPKVAKEALAVPRA